MIGTPAPVDALRVQHGVGRLRAAEVYAQSLADGLTLLARDDDAGRAERLAEQLTEVEGACGAIEEVVRPMLEAIDPHLADRADDAASIAQQIGERACVRRQRAAAADGRAA
jgi:hypothetical protein